MADLTTLPPRRWLRRAREQARERFYAAARPGWPVTRPTSWSTWPPASAPTSGAPDWYARHYARHLSHLRDRPINLLEIGVGGYRRPDAGGQSLRMWKHYFPMANIYGLDLHDKGALAEPRIALFRGSQADPEVLDRVADAIGRIDVIIDDGSHRSEHVLASFEHLFPRLAEGGVYAVEDTQTSYWADYGGNPEDRNDPRTTLGYFKALVDGLNHEEIGPEGPRPPRFSDRVVALHFYHNLLFVEKGTNAEGSNIRRGEPGDGDGRSVPSSPPR